ncbi:hypothetical protein Vretimale_11585, partial [Volvox reticuliferus]
EALSYHDTAIQFHALSTILRMEGVRGLCRGLWPTVLTNAPYSGLYYMFYTRLKEGLSAKGRPQVLVNFTIRVAAAVAVTLLTQPADVVRTRMQPGLGTASAGAAGGGGPAGAATGTALGAAGQHWATLHEAVRHQGPAALMTGVQMCMHTMWLVSIKVAGSSRERKKDTACGLTRLDECE